MIEKAKASKTSKIDVSTLERTVSQLKFLAERYETQSRFAKIWGQCRKNSDDIQMLRTNIEALVPMMALSVGLENVSIGVENGEKIDKIAVSLATLEFPRW